MSMSFTVELMMTEKCNLACKYCYIKQKPSDLTPESFDLFLNSIDDVLQLYNFDKFNVSYFGGEPLINYNNLVKFQKQLLEHPKFTHAVLITNGLLLDEQKLEQLRSLKVGISLSFDGLWNINNRPLSNGDSSLSYYLQRLQFFKEHFRGGKIMISPDSLDTLVDNFVFFVEVMGWNRPDYTLVRDDIWSDKDIEKFYLETRKLLKVVEEYLSKGQYYVPGFYDLWARDILLSNRLGKRPFGCFAGFVGCAYFPTGIYYPCARFGTIKKYPLYDAKEKKIIHDNFNFFKDRKIHFVGNYKKCKSCSIYTYCNGGCLFQQLENGNGKEPVPVDSVCELYKIIFRDTVYLMCKYEQMFKQQLVNFSKEVRNG